jgi:hypothetical protein
MSCELLLQILTFIAVVIFGILLLAVAEEL